MAGRGHAAIYRCLASWLDGRDLQTARWVEMTALAREGCAGASCRSVCSKFADVTVWASEVLPGWSWLAIQLNPGARSSPAGAPGAARPGCGRRVPPRTRPA